MEKTTAKDQVVGFVGLDHDRVKGLQELFPEAVIDGRIDLDVLKRILDGVTGEDDATFGLRWHGKSNVRRLALAPASGVLVPCPGESEDWDATRNLFIEGDNLEVLRLLQQDYSDKVQLIYIDPPYNTGKEFVYTDNFRDNVRNYRKLTRQGEGGRTGTFGPEANGRFHTDWLSMMYPRLVLARKLLAPGGIMFISIGDEEMHNLRCLCDEIFGCENFCGVFVWEKKRKPSFLDRNMGKITDYIVAYAKDRSRSPAFVAGSVKDGKKYPFNNAGNRQGILHFPARSVRFRCADQVVGAQDMSAGNIRTVLLDDVHIVDGTNANSFRLQGEWRYSQTKLDEFVSAKAEIVISKMPFRPNYVKRSGESKKTANLLSYRINGIPTNEDATEEMRRLFGSDVMSYPKPSGLIKYLVRAASPGDDIVLDFFAGSGTTAVGTMLQNIEDGRRRRFILVQLPERLEQTARGQEAAVAFCDSLGMPRTIAELTKERLRRTGRKLREDDPGMNCDVGFRVYKLVP